VAKVVSRRQRISKKRRRKRKKKDIMVLEKLAQATYNWYNG
jgi:hypothetical protein